MATSTVSLRITNVENPFPDTANRKPRTDKMWRLFMRRINRIIGGSSKNAHTIQTANHTATASGTVTIASGSGTVGTTINGVAITVTWGTSDTATATALAAAIVASANALVAPFVTATSALGVVTVTALRAGVDGNTITLAASGTGATASGARLTGGASTLVSYSF